MLKGVVAWVNQKGAGGVAGGAAQSVRRNYKYFKGTNLTVVEGMHQFIMYILSRTTSEETGAGCLKGWEGRGKGVPTASSRIGVGTCYLIPSRTY